MREINDAETPNLEPAAGFHAFGGFFFLRCAPRRREPIGADDSDDFEDVDWPDEEDPDDEDIDNDLPDED